MYWVRGLNSPRSRCLYSFIVEFENFAGKNLFVWIRYLLTQFDSNRLVWVQELNLPPEGWKFCTRTGGHELNQRVIGFWEYVRTVINAYLKNQVKNHSKIDNSLYNQKSKISKSQKENRDNMISPPKLFSLSLHQQNFLSFLVKLPLFSVWKSKWSNCKLCTLAGFWCWKNWVWY